jgi:Tol biopolymer transport system component
MRLDEAPAWPRLSPDGRTVAFSAAGKIGLVSVPLGAPRFVTFGVEWQDLRPAWRPDGKALAVVAQPSSGRSAELHLLTLETAPGTARREPILKVSGLEEVAPAFAPDGKTLVYLRDANVFRLDLASGQSTRLTGGFRSIRAARFLPSGRLLALWQQGKQCGLDAMDADGNNRETLAQGPAVYQAVAPSPDGHYLAATLAFEPTVALRQRSEVRLLDARGRTLGTLSGGRGHDAHSADWGR